MSDDKLAKSISIIVNQRAADNPIEKQTDSQTVADKVSQTE